MVDKIGKNERVCERCHSEVELDDLRCPLCGMATPTVAKRLEKVSCEILRCDSCGASLRYSVKARAPKCGFCGQVMHLESSEDPIVETERYLPFTVTREEAEHCFRQWLAGLGWFRPSDLCEKAGVDKVHALWWVAWAVDAQVLCSWTADTNHDTRRARWAPAAGQDPIHYRNLIISASKGLSFDETYKLVPGYDLNTAKAEQDGPDEAKEEGFELQRSEARHLVTNIIANAARNRVRNQSIPGTRHRNIHTALLLQKLQTLRIALPVYILAYRYHDKFYRVIINGQDSQTVFGDAPYSLKKILLAVGLTVLGVLLIVLLLLTVAAIASHS